IQGVPFVGKAGQLLTKILASVQLKREDVYITNINKCRPPSNRTPNTEEMETCFPYLEKQISFISPKIICVLGAAALKGLLKEEKISISSMRGKVHKYKGIDLIVTYHPAALLRYQKFKRPTWEDMKMLRRLYDEKYLKQPFILENK
ncbi:MAG: uracil-DNA glycosylase, partial [Calditrichia bacterium]|nr:uracil-DNA glycosylase [Calditrichia bacterium]